MEKRGTLTKTRYKLSFLKEKEATHEMKTGKRNPTTPEGPEECEKHTPTHQQRAKPQNSLFQSVCWLRNVEGDATLVKNPRAEELVEDSH